MITQKDKEHLAQDKKKSNILIRVLSALVIGPVFIIAILWLPWLFYALMLLVFIGMLSEWYNMAKSSWLDMVIGIVMIVIPILSLIIVCSDNENHWLLLLYFAIIWSVDTFAMIGGKTIGGAKLAPHLSPNKTWSGLFVGVLCASLVAVLLSLIPGFSISNNLLASKSSIVATSATLALIAQVSDLFVSYFKRKYSIKDSGNIIPGHGGVLDRFDSIILTAPLLFLITKTL